MARKAYPDGITELEFALEESAHRLVQELLFGDRGEGWLPERGFLGTISSGRGVRRRTLFLRTLVPQEEGWVRFGGGGLSFAPEYFSKALTEANRAPTCTGLIIVHSHPGSSYHSTAPVSIPRPSAPDLYHERELLWLAARSLRPGAPVVAGIVGLNGGWRIREYWWPRPATAREAASSRFASAAGSYLDAIGTRVVGPNHLQVQLDSTSAKPTRPEHDSTGRLWGHLGDSVLQRLRVGIAGVGGVGGIIAEYLARLGVGDLVLVDYDVLKTENFNRSQGARRRDIGKPKIDYVTRLAHNSSTTDELALEPVRASAVEWEGLRPLLDCDIILNAADDPFARQVLDYASYAYQVPVIDGGTAFHVSDEGQVSGRSQVSESGPGRPCLECQGVYTREEATLARESVPQQGPNRYVLQLGDQIDPEDSSRAPSVIAHNGLVASLMVQRLLRTVLRFPPYTTRFQQRFYVDSGEIRWGPVTECAEGCPKRAMSGLGDGSYTPVGVDPRWGGLRKSAGNPA